MNYPLSHPLEVKTMSYIVAVHDQLIYLVDNIVRMLTTILLYSYSQLTYPFSTIDKISIMIKCILQST